MPFHSTLKTVRLGGAWRVLEPLIYESKIAGQTFTVPAGFETDFASVPRLPLAFWIAGDTAHEAAVVHDFLYVTATTDKKTADAVFNEAMQELGVAWWRRSMMYTAVRLFGRGNFEAVKLKEETQ